jgi:hypothetical protein
VLENSEILKAERATEGEDESARRGKMFQAKNLKNRENGGGVVLMSADFAIITKRASHLAGASAQKAMPGAQTSWAGMILGNNTSAMAARAFA